MLKYKEKIAFTYNTQSVVYWRKACRKMWTLAAQNSDYLFTGTYGAGCYNTAAYFPFEPLEKRKIVKVIFPGLSRSCNFQEKILDFSGGVRTRLTLATAETVPGAV